MASSQAFTTPFHEKVDVNYKHEVCEIFELAAKHHMQADFLELGRDGPIHNATFIFRLTVGRFVAEAQGPTKIIAKTLAAQQILPELRRLPVPEKRQGANNSKKQKQQRLPEFKPTANPISFLHEIITNSRGKPAEYTIVNVDKSFEVWVFYVRLIVADTTVVGAGNSTKEAKRNAAAKALNAFGYKFPVCEPEDTKEELLLLTEVNSAPTNQDDSAEKCDMGLKITNKTNTSQAEEVQPPATGPQDDTPTADQQDMAHSEGPLPLFDLQMPEDKTSSVQSSEVAASESTLPAAIEKEPSHAEELDTIQELMKTVAEVVPVPQEDEKVSEETKADVQESQEINLDQTALEEEKSVTDVVPVPQEDEKVSEEMEDKESQEINQDAEDFMEVKTDIIGGDQEVCSVNQTAPEEEKSVADVVPVPQEDDKVSKEMEDKEPQEINPHVELQKAKELADQLELRMQMVMANAQSKFDSTGVETDIIGADQEVCNVNQTAPEEEKSPSPPSSGSTAGTEELDTIQKEIMKTVADVVPVPQEDEKVSEETKADVQESQEINQDVVVSQFEADDEVQEVQELAARLELKMQELMAEGPVPQEEYEVSEEMTAEVQESQKINQDSEVHPMLDFMEVTTDIIGADEEVCSVNQTAPEEDNSVGDVVPVPQEDDKVSKEMEDEEPQEINHDVELQEAQERELFIQMLMADIQPTLDFMGVETDFIGAYQEVCSVNQTAPEEEKSPSLPSPGPSAGTEELDTIQKEIMKTVEDIVPVPQEDEKVSEETKADVQESQKIHLDAEEHPMLDYMEVKTIIIGGDEEYEKEKSAVRKTVLTVVVSMAATSAGGDSTSAVFSDTLQPEGHGGEDSSPAAGGSEVFTSSSERTESCAFTNPQPPAEETVKPRRKKSIPARFFARIRKAFSLS